jgi:hypothetical protein
VVFLKAVLSGEIVVFLKAVVGREGCGILESSGREGYS